MSSIYENIISAVQSMNWIEIVSVLSGIIYVVLAARQQVWCWFFGIISAAFWAYAAFFQYKLYLDAGLQIYYVGIAFYGWYQWLYGNSDKTSLTISQLFIKQHSIIIISGTILSVGLGYYFGNYTDAARPYLDAFTTVFSIFTTYLVTRKYLENWIYWIIIDSVYVYLYIDRTGYLFAFLNVVFVIIAIKGYFNWRNDLHSQEIT